jgi:hypothetical protein
MSKNTLASPFCPTLAYIATTDCISKLEFQRLPLQLMRVLTFEHKSICITRNESGKTSWLVKLDPEFLPNMHSLTHVVPGTSNLTKCEKVSRGRIEVYEVLCVEFAFPEQMQKFLKRCPTYSDRCGTLVLSRLRPPEVNAHETPLILVISVNIDLRNVSDPRMATMKLLNIRRDWEDPFRWIFLRVLQRHC